MTKSAGRAILVALSCSLAALSAAAQTVSEQPSRVAAAGRTVPVADCGPQAPTIDGDLADWGDLRRNGMTLSERLDCSWGKYAAGSQPDAALVKVMADADAIYVAARVADASVINPTGPDTMWTGDCFEVFLDLRPLRGPGDLLGAPGYTPGVWQFLVMPPTDDGKPFAWRKGVTGAGSLGPVEIASRRASGGYEVEMRLPLASLLPRAPAGRLEEPFGFDVQIDDIDAPGTPGATAQAMGYSWSGVEGYSQDASLIACSSRRLGRRPESNLLRFEPAVVNREAGKLAAQVVAVVAGQPAGVELDIEWRHQASSYDRASAPAGSLVPAMPKVRLDRATAHDDYAWLGVSFYRRAWRLQLPAPGRYYVTARCRGEIERSGRARLYLGTGGYGLQRVIGSPSEQDALDAVNVVHLVTYYPSGRKVLPGTIFMSPAPALSFALSEDAYRAETAGRSWTSPWQVALTLAPHGEQRVLWTQSVPIQPRTPLRVPLKGLAEGVYDLRAALVTPGGRRVSLTREVNAPRGAVTESRDVSFRIMPRRPVYLASRIRDAHRVLTHATALGNPAREQFPRDDMRDAQARSVHDLQWFDGRIYVGVGDWNENRGPIRIVSFAPVRAGEAPEFRPEFTVDDESVDTLRVSGSTLYAPGIDARESWDLGNYYFKRDEQWTKRRTVPNGLHVLDVAEFRGRLYVTAGTELGAALYESADDGVTFRRCGPAFPQEGRFREMTVLPDGLLVMSETPRRGAFLLTADAPEPLFAPLLPELGARDWWGQVVHLERFGDGVVYTTRVWNDLLHGTLHYLGDLRSGALAVRCFRDKSVTDVVVRDKACYVLVVRPRRNGRALEWRGTVYRSHDLRTWERVATAPFPAFPSALEVAQGAYYIGLANHKPWKSADKDSGSLWRVGE